MNELQQLLVKYDSIFGSIFIILILLICRFGPWGQLLFERHKQDGEKSKPC